MEKRLIKTFFVTFVFLILWTYFFPQQKPVPGQQESAEQGSHAADQQSTPAPGQTFRPAPSDTQPLEPAVEKTPQGIQQAIIGNFVVNYSETGGYISELVVNGDEEPLPFKNIGFSEQYAEEKFQAKTTVDKLIFQSSRGTKEFTFNEYVITITTSPPLQAPMTVFASYPDKNVIDQRYQELFYFKDNSLTRKYVTDRFFGLFGKGIVQGEYENIVFAGARNRYYCAALLRNSYTLAWTTTKFVSEDDKGAKVKASLVLPSPPGMIELYVGPQADKFLQPFDLQGIMYYGFFHALGVFMIKILQFFHLLTKSWGMSIMLFSAVIYVALFPFTAKSMKSMKKIQQVQPEMDALKAKYKDNPQKLQKETLEFYKKNKINPASGCLPLLFQMPVFLTMYQVIFRLFDLKGASFLWIKDLSQPDRMFELPFTIPVLSTNYFNLLPILVMVLGFVQQKATASASSSAAASQQKSMGLFMTVFIGFIFYTFPSALVLYWFTQNIFTLLYQLRIAQSKTA